MCKYRTVTFLICGCTAKELYYLCPEAERNCTPCVYNPSSRRSNDSKLSSQDDTTDTPLTNKKTGVDKGPKEQGIVIGTMEKTEEKALGWKVEYEDLSHGENGQRFVFYDQTEKCDTIERCDFCLEDWEESRRYRRTGIKGKVWDW